MIRFLTSPYFTFLPYEHAALLSGLVWGQKNLLEPEQYDLFQTTGLLHMLVLSGQNITLLSEFVAVLLTTLNLRRISIMGAQIAVALFYLCLFFGEPSIVRAAIMSLILTLSKIKERSTRSIFILVLTATLMLSINPKWFYDVSFWLSINSTAGILVIYPYLNRNQKNPFIESFYLALSAQLGTLPITISVFREINLIAIPMNVAVSWIIEPIMVMGVILSFTGTLIPIIGALIGFILNSLIIMLLTLAKFGYSISPIFIFRF